MKTVRPSRARRLVGRAGLLAGVVLLLATAWACPRTGRYLVLDTVTGPADAVVVLGGSRAERWLEAVDLYKEKMAPRIILSSGRIEPAEERLRERGIRFPREVDLMRDAILQLGVPAADVEVFPSVDNTAAEADAMRTIAASRGWRRLIVVTSKYHTRRSLFAFERKFKGSGVTIEIRGTGHETSFPDQWWKHRPDVRFVISEVIKLALYRFGLEG